MGAQNFNFAREFLQLAVLTQNFAFLE